MRYLICLILSFFLVQDLYSLDVSVTTASFRTDQVNYIEVYMQVIGKTVTFDTLDNGRLKAGVEVTVLFEAGDSVVTAERFFLRSPELKKVQDFVEIRRYVLDNGGYSLTTSFTDVRDEENTIEIIQNVDIEFTNRGIQQSDVRLLSSFKKEDGTTHFHRNGYFLEPLPFNYYHRFNSTLIFYNELYGSDSAIGEDFLVTYKIKRRIKEGSYEEVDMRYRRVSPMPVNVILGQLDISALTSGNYIFEVAVEDRDRNVLSFRNIEFTRSNPVADLEVLEAQKDEELTWLDTFDVERIEYAMMALEPTLTGQDVETLNFLLSKGKLKFKKNFIYHIYESRYPGQSEAAFHQYMEVADAINRMFKSGMGYGFETDRGRTYLRYGRPDERIRVEDDQGAFPYEIWYYNRIDKTGQTDVRFLFYNPELATNHFLLLTSNCRGERNNPRWEMVLYRNAAQNPTDNIVDATRVQNNYRRRARELYED
ncbi:MAG: GWxTD domain-containing protein [Saprospiraceae bacterium]|nr:GWxTD domain-containing protein [Saprospiraceae bacterium]